MRMIKRDLLHELLAAAREYPVVTVLGPRQSGKTTLAQSAFADKPYRSLEDPDVRLLAQEDPRGFLADLSGGTVLDEVQRVPNLLSYIQGMVDKNKRAGQFILTGSHQPEVHQAISQSLAGRTALLTLLPFSFQELRHYRKKWTAFDLIVKGTFPRLHDKRLQADRFFNGYIQTYLERDIRSLIHLKDMRRFQQFLTLLAGRVGQIINYTSLANDVGVSSMTIKDWVSVLSASFIVFELPPYFENISKRVIKSPKLFFVDPGLAAHLAGIHTVQQVERDPLRGGLFENLVVAEVLKRQTRHGLVPSLFFYRDSHGNEVDLVVRTGRDLIPIEIKSAATFHPDFCKGIERFRAVTGVRARCGVVFYNGEQKVNYRDTVILNPLRHDPWDALVGLT